MLVNVPSKRLGPVMSVVLGAVGSARTGAGNIARGFYVSTHWSFEHTTSAVLEESWPSDTGTADALEAMGLDSSYGVCDTPEQFMERFGPALDASPIRWVVSFVVIQKADESPSGGWRWHKWGPYVGDMEPKCEYLYDEGPEITQATTFHVYRVLSGAVPT